MRFCVVTFISRYPVPRTLISLGSNLADPASQIHRAWDALANLAGVQLVSTSRLWTTRPVGAVQDEPAYQNAAAILETDLSPPQCLAHLQQIESASGRTREARWAARTLDLDLLLYDSQVIDQLDLQIPHRRMSFRRFVLEPAVEIAPEWLHPEIGLSLRELLEHLDRSPDRIDVAGLSLPEKRALVERVAQDLPRDVPRVRNGWSGQAQVDPDQPSVTESGPPRVLVLLLFATHQFGSDPSDREKLERVQSAIQRRFERFAGPRLAIRFEAQQPDAERELRAVVEAAAAGRP